MDSLDFGQSPDDYQTQGQAWNPCRPDILPLLTRSRVVSLEPIYYGSNHCFLATLDGGDAGTSLAVYKPARGEYPLYDFPSGTLFKREIGSWIVDHMLGWTLVPPTVESRAKYGAGSLQLFIESHVRGEIDIVELQRMALLDLILNNADRKSDHCLLGDGGKLWGIDHGLTFHVHPKLRTILWHFAGDPIPPDSLVDLKRLLSCLERVAGTDAAQLRGYITTQEWRALVVRVSRLLESGRFPDPRHKPVPYRW